MISTPIQPDNGYVVIAEIFTKPKVSSGLINPHNEQPLAPMNQYEDHPWRGLVVSAPRYYFSGGLRYECEIKPGDIVYLPGYVIENGTAYLVADGVKYPCVRHGDILAHITPSAEERQAIVLMKDVKETPLAIAGQA